MRSKVERRLYGACTASVCGLTARVSYESLMAKGEALEAVMKKYKYIVFCAAMFVPASAVIAQNHFEKKFEILRQEAINLYRSGQMERAQEIAVAAKRIRRTALVFAA